MSEKTYFRLNDYFLTVSDKAFLVSVSKDFSPTTLARTEELPDWVFRSRNAIWLVEEEAPIYQRALHGERVRESLLSFFKENFRRAQSSRDALESGKKQVDTIKGTVSIH